MLAVNFSELREREVRVLGILGSSPPEIATWQMTHPFYPLTLALVVWRVGLIQGPPFYGRRGRRKR